MDKQGFQRIQVEDEKRTKISSSSDVFGWRDHCSGVPRHLFGSVVAIVDTTLVISLEANHRPDVEEP